MLLLLLTAHTAPVSGSASPPLTFEDRDPITGNTVTCDRCPPGQYLRARCSVARKSDCAPCPDGSFTELWNHIGKCLRCGVCGQNQVVKTPCSADRDCQCQCKQGYYYKPQYDMCLRHSACPSGQGVLTTGTPDMDTVCQTCPNGTFSDSPSALKNCSDYRRCSGAGLQVALGGSSWHDNVCVNCSALKDGADYLREILPSFFIHQKINIKRLRRIVHRLPSEDGRRQAGTSDLDLSELHARINEWVGSATPAQVRELPKVLTDTGATGASERLQKKLQRVDAQLKEQCVQGNEVEPVLVSA